MALHCMGESLDYFPCRYAGSRLLFRGPHRRVEGRYCAVLGGTETYGKFVADPFPRLLERAAGIPALNLGVVNAGVDAFLRDPAVAELTARASVVVIQLPGAHALGNPFYMVHPRRNDRFLAALPPLADLYPEVDFTEFHFVLHMLSTLRRRSQDRFAAVVAALRSAWLAGMRELIRRCSGPVVLLCLSRAEEGGHGLGRDPLLVTPDMVAALRPLAVAVVEVGYSAPTGLAERAGMMLSPEEAAAAAELPGASVHALIADRLARALQPLLAA